MEHEPRNISTDELAAMMNRSFDFLQKSLSEKIDSSEERLSEKLDRIENVLIRDDRKRIERIEDKLLKVEVILGKRL